MVALQIALVHLLYNLAGVFAFLVIPVLRELPIRSAGWLGRRVEINRGWAVGYLLGVFFVLPGAVFGGETLFNGAGTAPEIVEAEQNEKTLKEAEEAVQEESLAIE
jgi:sodium-dependent phosphate cotransporter